MKEPHKWQVTKTKLGKEKSDCEQIKSVTWTQKTWGCNTGKCDNDSEQHFSDH